MSGPSTPFAFSGTLQLPSDPTLPQDPIPFGLAAQFSSENKQVLNLTGSGSKSIPFGTVGSAGLNGLLIKVDANTAAAPILVTINGSSAPVEISPGGFMALGSPNPAAGITSITIAFTSVNVVRIWGLGN
jgi:hypothetical protein